MLLHHRRLLLAVLFAAVIPIAPGLSAQAPVRVGTMKVPGRLDVASCSTSDSLLGPAPKDVLHAEVHGTLGPGAAYNLRSGPTSYGGDPPQAVSITSLFAARGILPTGHLTAFFPASILDSSRAQSEPIELVVDDTLTSPLSTPSPPMIDGPVPSSLPFTALLRPDDLLALARAHKAKVTFLGKTVNLRGSTINEVQAALRLAVCQLAAGSVPQ